MAHIPTQESDVQKVFRIAKELDISIEDAAVTCDAFELAFSNEGLRRQIFGMIDQLDESAAKKGEPLGLIITYAVEVGTDGIRVGRYADEIPPGEVVSLTPTNRAVIYLRIKDNFPTQQFLGPMIVNRPVYEFENEELPEFLRTSEPAGVLSDKSEIPDPKSQIDYGMVRSDCDTTESEVHLTLDERFPFLSASASETFRTGPISCFGSAISKDLARPIVASPSHRGSLTSGLSPPPSIGELGHSDPKDVLPSAAHIRIETNVSHLDL